MLGLERLALLSHPHPTHPTSTTAQTSTEYITQKLALRTSAMAFSFCQRFLLPCGFYAYVQMILILSHRKKKNSICFFIKVQPLPCQSKAFISLSMDCSCQPVIIVRYLDNSRLIIPTSEKLPFVNYIATNEAQMHSRRCPLSLSLSLSCTGAKPQDQHWHLNSVLMEAWDFRPHHSEGLFHCEHVEIAFT